MAVRTVAGAAELHVRGLKAVLVLGHWSGSTGFPWPLPNPPSTNIDSPTIWNLSVMVSQNMIAFSWHQ